MERFYTETQIMVRDNVRKFAESVVMPAADGIDKNDVFFPEIYKSMAEMGLFGADLPEEAGGVGFDTVTVCIAMEELAKCSSSVGNAYAIPVEAARFFYEHGNDTHKAKIPAIVSGECIPATAVSEPDFGSDVGSLRTTAKRDGNDYVINGVKAWVTLGRVADFVLVFAKTDPTKGVKGISCFMVEADNPGMTCGKAEKLLGMHGMEDCQIVFEDCRVPAENMMGPENGAFKMAMANFNYSRIMMSAMALGIVQGAYEDALNYAKERIQFGKPIIDFQAVQFMLADMSKDIAAARLLIHHAARLRDAGHEFAKEASHAKLFTTDMAMEHIANALQIHGGNGYSQEYRIERMYRDIKLTQIFEGTNQIQRLIIARQISKD